MHQSTVLLSTWLLLTGGVQSLAPPQPSETTGWSQGVTWVDARCNVDPGVPLLSSTDGDEDQDFSRRLLLTSMISWGILTTAEPANATATAQHQNQAMLSPTFLQSDALAVDADPLDWKGIVQKASKKALGGGKAGASAAVVQVFSLMWLRTSMNYQVRNRQGEAI